MRVLSRRAGRVNVDEVGIAFAETIWEKLFLISHTSTTQMVIVIHCRECRGEADWRFNGFGRECDEVLRPHW